MTTAAKSTTKTESIDDRYARCRILANLSECAGLHAIEKVSRDYQRGSKSEHATFVCAAAIGLFDILRDKHGLTDLHCRHLLWAGAILHDIGQKCPKTTGVPNEHAWRGAAYVLRHSDKLKLKKVTAAEIAALVFLHRSAESATSDLATTLSDNPPNALGPVFREVLDALAGRVSMEIVKLVAILRVADGFKHENACKLCNCPADHLMLDGNTLRLEALSFKTRARKERKDALLREVLNVEV